MGRSTGPTSTDRLQQLYELAGGQAGYFTAAQARTLGYSPRALLHHVSAGHFERMARGFYRLVGVPVSPHEDIVAAWVRYQPRAAVVSHDTALALYGLAPSRAREIHLTVPRARRLRAPQSDSATVVHTATTPLRRDEVAHRFAVQLTTPARTIVDLADAGSDPQIVIEATVSAVGSGLVSAGEMREAARDRSLRVRQLIGRALREAAPSA